MNIYQANAPVTDAERDKTKRVCELLGWSYTICNSNAGYHEAYIQDGKECGACGKRAGGGEILPTASFTLDQCVEMLKELGARYCIETDSKHAYWVSEKHMGRDCRPHDLTAALDAIIGVLKEKKKGSK